MKTIRVSVRGDSESVECIVSPPAVPVPVGFGTTTGPSGALSSVVGLVLSILYVMGAKENKDAHTMAGKV